MPSTIPPQPLRLACRCTLIALGLGLSGGWPVQAAEPPAPIARVAQMPNLPRPLQVRDWHQATRDYIDLVFDFDRHGEYLPLVSWRDERRTMVTLPSYVGAGGGPEGINYLAAVVSGSLVGLDMRSFRGQNWVALGSRFFDPESGACSNWVRRGTGGSLWYDVLPDVLFYQIGALYPGDPDRERQMRTVAETWYRACVALGGRPDPPAPPDFDHTGFNTKTMTPVDNGKWIEPEGAAGIAWLEYMAWTRFRDPRFLTAADWAVRALERKPVEANPLYEVLLPYGALAAARLNAELGRSHDVAKLVNWCFTPHGKPQARPYWGVITDRWNGLDVHGLVGSTTDGGGYAFTMNTFEWAGALAPQARYDSRYAHDIGKWMLNLANAARLFYPNAHDAEHQTSFGWSSKYDRQSVIAYEGLRKWKRGTIPARADYRTVRGRIALGSYRSTQFYREEPTDIEVLEEAAVESGPQLKHLWEFDLPDRPRRWLVAAARRVDGGHAGNAFRFSFAPRPEGPYTPAFAVSGPDAPKVVELPADLRGKLYLKVESRDRSRGQGGCDALFVDALAISYQATAGPFAQGDLVVSFIDLVDDSTVPIVLYRPESVVTDLGLYGSSHVGLLGGMIRPTNVAGILRLDLLRTDFFHGTSDPTYLYYNPYDVPKAVAINLGPEPRDLYDAVAHEYRQRNVNGSVEITIPPDTATVLVIAPAGGKLRREGNRTLIDDVIVDFGHPE